MRPGAQQIDTPKGVSGGRVRGRLLVIAAATLAAPLVMHGCLPGESGVGSQQGEPIAGATVLGQLGEAPGQFAYPRALEQDGSHLWVVDKSARVQELDPVTGECIAWFRMPEFELGKPVGITCGPGPDGGRLLYIPDTHYHRVMVYRPPARPAATNSAAATLRPVEPELVASFGSYGDGPGQFIYPTDIAILPTADGLRMERLYVTEYGGNDRVSVYDRDFNFLFSFGSFGIAEEEAPDAIVFQRPQCIEIDPAAGEVYVVDSRNHRIGRFTLDGHLKGWIGGPHHSGRALGEFRYPYAMALLGDGTALVAEFGNNRVQRVDLATGEGLRVWGRAGRARGELATPWAITVMGQRTFVLDSGNNRIVAFPTPPPARKRGA